MKILVVEDDPKIAALLKDALEADSHAVDLASDGAEGSFLGRSYEYDAILLDYSMPEKSGLIVCKEIRGIGKHTPILFLSMTDDPEVKVAAFENGADDYMVKPFSIQELMARLKVLTKRKAADPDQEHHAVTIDDLVLDPDKHLVKRGESLIHLTRKEFTLLEYMMRHSGLVLSRAMIMEHVWTADSDPFSNTVEAHIRNLRRKTSVDDKPNLIINIPGRGYILDTPENLKRHR